MGVKGLTTYISNKSDHCMENYQLHDTNVVIDGDAVLCHLYMNHTVPRNSCFGGDYDKYGNTIFKFFHMLFQCKIKPYIVLDGGYESRKLKTISERFENRITQAEKLNAKTESRNQTTPIFIREAFEDIALKLGIKLIRCDFEGDRETANIAKALNCPVISNDSDFYIFDVPYIPFFTVKLSVQVGTISESEGSISYKYLPCQLYRVDKFLRSVGDMNKVMLPIFAALIGNDFIDGIELSKLGIHTKNQHFLQKFDDIIKWLQTHTRESAIEAVLNSYDNTQRESILKKLEDAINGYTFKDSIYLKYLTGKSSDENMECDNDDNEYNTFTKLTCNFPKPFLENYRKSLYPTRLMEMLTVNKYYNFKPQIEVKDYDHAHDISVDIVVAMHKILTGSVENLVCLKRSRSNAVEATLPLCKLQLPSFVEIQNMDVDARKTVIRNILNIGESFITNSLNSFPESWHLLILTLRHMMEKIKLPQSLVYSVILCKLIIDFVDPKIGFFRDTSVFKDQFYLKIKSILAKRKVPTPNAKNLKNALDSITYEDALVGLSQLIPFFEFNKHIRDNSKYFDRKLMHSLSQFQSCLLHVKCLNQLLNMPYQDFLITECYNGTFVYNMTVNLRKRDNIDDYLKRVLLHKAPLLSQSFEIMVKLIKGMTIDM